MFDLLRIICYSINTSMIIVLVAIAGKPSVAIPKGPHSIRKCLMRGTRFLQPLPTKRRIRQPDTTQPNHRC